MDLTKIFHREAILLDLVGGVRDHAILELVKVLEDQGHLASEHRDEVLLALLKRERSSGTGIGSGVALPHVKTEYIDQIRGVIGLSSGGLDFASPDDTKVRVVFLLLSPTWAVQEHLHLMSLLGRLIRCPDFLYRLQSARREAEIHNLLGKCESFLDSME